MLEKFLLPWASDQGATLQDLKVLEEKYESLSIKDSSDVVPLASGSGPEARRAWQIIITFLQGLFCVLLKVARSLERHLFSWCRPTRPIPQGHLFRPLPHSSAGSWGLLGLPQMEGPIPRGPCLGPLPSSSVGSWHPWGKLPSELHEWTARVNSTNSTSEWFGARWQAYRR